MYCSTYSKKNVQTKNFRLLPELQIFQNPSVFIFPHVGDSAAAKKIYRLANLFTDTSNHKFNKVVLYYSCLEHL